MESKPKTDGWMGLIVAKGICCGVLLYAAATGALGSAGGWLSDGSLIWLVAVAAFAVVGTIFWRRKKPRGSGTNVSPRAQSAPPLHRS